MAGPMIRVRDVSKTFLIPREKTMTLREHLLGFFRGRPAGSEPLEALRDVGFDVERGEFFSIIGKNGSGKSTLLKIIAGIYAPDAGGVAVDGTLSPFLELGIAFNPELTARENVFLSGAVIGLRREEVAALYDGIIAFSELERFQDQKLKNFSSGMKVRLAFSVAFKVDADILLVDEVLAVGDASFREKCYEVFRRLKAEGKTILYVSHSMADVKAFSDRVLLLHEGRIVSAGEPEKIIHDYQLLTAREDERRIALEEGTAVPAAFAPPAGGARWGSGGAAVARAELLGADGRAKHVVATGEPVRVRIAFTAAAPAAGPLRVTAAIRRADGVTVLETASEPMETGGGGVAVLAFPRFDLLAATYDIDIGLLPGKGDEPHDFIRRCLTVRTYQESGSVYGKIGGISYIPHEWIAGPEGGR
ncbi:MAG: ABC transporter ATP-binding protein [bacterium]|nr:ABC transporter ATP-binding protein [bacterium]